MLPASLLRHHWAALPLGIKIKSALWSSWHHDNACVEVRYTADILALGIMLCSSRVWCTSPALYTGSIRKGCLCTCQALTAFACCFVSEMRAAHKMSAKLGRDIIIGGTSLDIPNEFLEHLKVGCFGSASVAHGFLLQLVMFIAGLMGLHVPQELGEPHAGSTFEIDANNNV